MPDGQTENWTAESLASCELFKGLDAEQLRQVFEQGSVKPYKPESVLIHEGYSWDKLFVILDGEVEVFLPKAGHRFTKVTLTKLKLHSTFGEFSFVDSKPVSASVATTVQSALFSIDFKALRSLLDSDEHLANLIYKNLLVVLVGKLRTSNQELDEVGLS